jgi:hypothetical protein
MTIATGARITEITPVGGVDHASDAGPHEDPAMLFGPDDTWIVAGEQAAVADALEAIDRKRREWADEDGCQPLKAWQAPLACWLHERTYSDRAIHIILDHAARFGTAQCCRWLEPEDMDKFEAMLPGNAWLWGEETDAEVWATND